MAPTQNILVIGAGELGLQVLRSLVEHQQQQQQEPRNATVSVLLRPTSIPSSSNSTSTCSQKQKEIDCLRSMGVHLVPGDVVEDSEHTLASIFASYDTIISCMGFVAGKGTQLKLTRAVLLSSSLPSSSSSSSSREDTTKRYIPWQFGVDYDIIGRGSAQDLFDEQLDVRDLLRSQQNSKTRWAIISTGMFTSFLFEPSFGVVDVENSTVRALGSWENRITVTTPEDIGRFTADIVLGEESDHLFSPSSSSNNDENGKVIYVGGDTISYADLARMVEDTIDIVRKPLTRTVLAVDAVRDALAKDPGNSLLKYQAVFGKGDGVAWDLSETWNWQRGMRATTAEQWAREHLV